MTHQMQSTALDQIAELLAENGFDGLASAVAVLLNEVMKIERGHANGFKPRTVHTRVGPLALQMPQARGVEFYPSALEKGLRSERALKAEMYVQGASTRKVAAITVQLCGLEVTSGQVSRAAALLDEELEEWRSRPLGEIPYLILDARYEHVRHGGQILSCAVLVAIGIDREGRRSILGVSVSLSEAEAHWRDLLASLAARGLHGMQFVASDAHSGLKPAPDARLTGVAWQSCQFHLMQNAMAFVPKPGMRKAVVASIRAVFDAPDRHEAQRQLDIAVKKYRTSAPRLAEWLGPHPRGAVGVRPAAFAPVEAVDDQHAGAAEQEVEATNSRGGAVPQRGVGAAARLRRGDGDQRGVGDEPKVPDHGAGLTRRSAEWEFTETELQYRAGRRRRPAGTSSDTW